MVRAENGGTALPRLISALVSTFRSAAAATSANGVPALSLSSISAALARSTFATWSLRQRVSTSSLTSSSVRSRSGVMPATSYQT